MKCDWCDGSGKMIMLGENGQCPICKGSGEKQENRFETCQRYGGKGKRKHFNRPDSAPSGICLRCNGTGLKVAE